MRWGRLGSGSLLAAAVAVAPVGAQGGPPPPPLPVDDVRLPEVHEATLSSGVAVLVVPQHEVPYVTVSLTVPGGTVADPPGKEGVATLVARLLARGSVRFPADEVASSFDRLGIAFTAEAVEEWSTLRLGVTTPGLDEGLAILADMVVAPTFPAEAVEGMAARAHTGLRVQEGEPRFVADRAFARALYGDHPYGRLATTASVGRISREDVVAFHRAWYRPDGALIVVSGDVDPERVVERLDHAFRGWRPAPRPAVVFPRAPDRERPEIVVVHHPGAVQAEIRIGHLLAGGETPDWLELQVANEVLGGGPAGRLQQLLRDRLGYTYDARSSVEAGRRLGEFRIATASRPEGVGTAVQEILEQVERLRRRALPSDELEDHVSFLVGSFPRSVETPQQVAEQVAVRRMLGLSDEALATYRTRVAAIDTAAIRAVAELRLRPEQFLVVVVGEADVVQPRLRGLGEVTIVDGGGRPLSWADVAVSEPTDAFDLRGLQPATLRYALEIGGVVRGEATRILEPVEGGWRFASAIDAGVQQLEQEVVVDERLGLLSSRTRVATGGAPVRIEVRREGDRLRGESATGGSVVPIDMEVPRGVTLSDGLELALWTSELEVGREFRLPVADVRTGTVTSVRMRVEAETEVTVPAGTVPVYRVSVDGRNPQIFYVRRSAPHIPVRMEAVGRPVAVELLDVGGR